MKAHEDKDLECPVCDKSFARQSFILLHLERSRCGSTKRVNALASKCRDQSYNNIYDFINDDQSFCCENCNASFGQLSSLFQHVEDTPNCSITYFFGDLNYVAKYIFGNIG